MHCITEVSLFKTIYMNKYKTEVKEKRVLSKDCLTSGEEMLNKNKK